MIKKVIIPFIIVVVFIWYRTINFDTTIVETNYVISSANRLLISVLLKYEMTHGKILVDNLLRLTQTDTFIVIHLNQDIYKKHIQEYHYLHSLRRIIINPNHLKTGWCSTSLLLAHISNFEFANTRESFSHIMFFASNQLLLRKNVEELVFTLPIAPVVMLSKEHVNDKDSIQLSKYLHNRTEYDFLARSSHEGFHLPAVIFQEFIEFLDLTKFLKLSDKHKRFSGACPEESILQSYLLVRKNRLMKQYLHDYGFIRHRYAIFVEDRFHIDALKRVKQLTDKNKLTKLELYDISMNNLKDLEFEYSIPSKHDLTCSKKLFDFMSSKNYLQFDYPVQHGCQNELKYPLSRTTFYSIKRAYQGTNKLIYVQQNNIIYNEHIQTYDELLQNLKLQFGNTNLIKNGSRNN